MSHAPSPAASVPASTQLSPSHLALALAVVFVWGTNFAIIKLALAHLPGLEDSDYGIEFSDANYTLAKAAIDQRFQTFQRVKTD